MLRSLAHWQSHAVVSRLITQWRLICYQHQHYTPPTLHQRNNAWSNTLKHPTNTTMGTCNNAKSPHLRSHRPLCSWCYLFNVSSSGLLFLHISGSGFPSFTLSLTVKNEHFSSCDLELWHTTMTYKVDLLSKSKVAWQLSCEHTHTHTHSRPNAVHGPQWSVTNWLFAALTVTMHYQHSSIYRTLTA